MDLADRRCDEACDVLRPEASVAKDRADGVLRKIVPARNAHTIESITVPIEVDHGGLSLELETKLSELVDQPFLTNNRLVQRLFHRSRQ